MAFTLHSLQISIPLGDLPVAAAAFDRNTEIVAANEQFFRLCGVAKTAAIGMRLADIVAESDRDAVDTALNDLTIASPRGPCRLSINALRAAPPALWLAIEVAALGPEAMVPYIACVQTLSRRRRADSIRSLLVATAYALISLVPIPLAAAI
jgi:hypothetical protein